ncbi:hypothetical protein E6R60_25465 [Streptomyces sp. A0642]|uniref:hypothetical protein n=1 Tax=Streptomyces sp. A0642 TaxID=2563100 RepID=UPI0010A221F0|nr:hypothetical protein [Streptomyces sp. A0642]THA73137.1 hypothetical protein E6R60_25465 [Streptomyces sp. A0642]
MPRRRTGTPRRVVILIVVMASLLVLSPVALVVAFFYVWGKNHEDLRFPDQDVSIVSCRKDEVTGGPVAEVRVESRAKRPGTFTVHVRFRAPRGKGGSDPAGKRTVIFRDLAVGATATRSAAGPAPVRGRPQCVLADVTFLSTALARQSASATP